MNNKPINQAKKEITEVLPETINLRQHMPTTNKQKKMKVKKLFREIISKLENREIYFAGDGREFFLFGGRYQIKIGELEMEFKNHNGYEGEDWNREFKEQLEKDSRVS